MSVVFRLKTGDAASPRGFVGDDSLPKTSPQAEETMQSGLPSPADGSNLAPCPQCGVANGASALVCWGCEAVLSAAGPFKPVAALGTSGEEPEDLKQPPVADGELRSSLTAGLWGDHSKSVGVPGGPAAPTRTPDARPQTDADSVFPEAPSAFEGTDPMAALSIPAAVAAQRTREIVAAVVLVSLVGAWAYPHFRTPHNDTFDVPLAPDIAQRADRTALLPALVAPTNADPAQTRPADSIRPDAVSRAADEALAAATRALSVQPSAQTIVEAGRLVATPTDRRVGVVTRPTTSGALTETYRGKARGATQSAEVASVGSTREPARPGSAQHVPAPVAPCTAAVVALGLCTALPNQSKE